MSLFNKDGEGTLELHNLTGTFYASNRYENIASEIEAATVEVRRIVGNDLMDRAEEHYRSSAYSPDGDSQDDLLVSKLRLPVACLAMRRYFQQNIVSHEDSGLKLKVGDDEKVPWEWMFDRDDRALRERYFRSLDAVYDFLEHSELTEWKSTPLHQMISEAIVRNLSDFERVYPIDHSYYTFFMLLPLIVETQESKLRPILKDRWSSIIEGEDVALLRLAQQYVVLETLSVAAERWSLEVFPQSIARRFAPSYQGNQESAAASISEVEYFTKSFRRHAEEALRNLLALFKQTEHPYEGYPMWPDNDRRNKFFTT